MARARNIKPALFKNELLGVADPLITILFESLWCLADREGRLEDRPLRIKAETFPYRDGINVDGFLNDLRGMGFIERYTANNIALIQICNFKKHQTPHNTEKASEYPAPLTQVIPLNNESETPFNPLTDSLNPPADSLIPKRKRGDDYPAEFEEAWSEYPSRPGANKQTAFKAWSARMKAGVDPEIVIAGIKRYACYVTAMRTDPQYIKQPATFLGPDEHYKADWTAQPRASPQGYESPRDKSRRETIEALTGRKQNDNRTIDIN